MSKYSITFLLVLACFISYCQKRILLRDINSGANSEYEITNIWHDGSPLEDAKIDGVIYVKRNGKFYKRLFSGSINVKWFGAKGNNIADDALAINKALKYLQSSRKKKYAPFYNNTTKESLTTTLFFPNGVYKVNSSLKIPSYITLQGESREGTILVTTSRDMNLLDISAQNELKEFENYTYSYTNISNLTLAGPHFNINPFAWKFEPGSQKGGCGILFSKNVRLKLDTVRITGFEKAGFFSDYSAYIFLSNVQIDNNTCGILAQNSTTTINARDCVLQVNSVGIHLENSFSNTFINCIIETNIANFLSLPKIGEEGLMYSKAGQGVFLQGSYNNSFRSCYIEDNIISVSLMNAKNNTFEGCLFCPNNDYSSKNGFANTQWLSFFDTGNSGNRFVNSTFVTVDEKVYPSKKVDIKSSNYGSDNIIFSSDINDFLNLITANDNWKVIFKQNEKNAPILINEGTGDIFRNLKRMKAIEKQFSSSQFYK